jgi:hypothetical protein
MGSGPYIAQPSCRFDLRPDGTSAAGEVLWFDANVYITPAFENGGPDPDHLLVVVNRHGDQVFGQPCAGWHAALPALIEAMPTMQGYDYGWNPPYWVYWLGGVANDDGSPGMAGRTITYHDHLHVVPRPIGRPTTGMSPEVAAKALDEIVTG